jgi:membrane-associated phospholipid phosphatase
MVCMTISTQSTITYLAAHGNGYGFPSSHSQYMGYFAAFLVCHMYFTHRFPSAGSVLDALWRFIVYSVLYSWAGAVAYSRYVLCLCNFYMDVTCVVALDII